MFRIQLAVLTLLSLIAGGLHAGEIVPPLSWSGDGSKIAVAAKIDDMHGVHIFDTEGRRVVFVPFQHEVVAIKWPSKDGPFCLLARHPDGRHYLWLANPYGVIAQLSNRPAYVPKCPSANLFTWSPDCRHIAFASSVGGDVDLWCVGVERASEQRLTSSKGRDFGPAWSPDGKRIAFASDRSGSLGIWVVPSSGGAARKVVDESADEQHPAWSHDGTRLAYLSNGKTHGIRIVPASGGKSKAVAVGGRNYLAPVWSSTSKWIGFAYGRNPTNIFATVVTAAKGWGPYYQTTFDRSDGVSTSFRVPAWSPACDQLAYCTYEDGRLSVRIATLSEKHGPAVRSIYTALATRLKPKPD